MYMIEGEAEQFETLREAVEAAKDLANENKECLDVFELVKVQTVDYEEEEEEEEEEEDEDEEDDEDDEDVDDSSQKGG